MSNKMPDNSDSVDTFIPKAFSGDDPSVRKQIADMQCQNHKQRQAINEIGKIVERQSAVKWDVFTTDADIHEAQRDEAWDQLKEVQQVLAKVNR